ncbi:MAG: hypothetical protein R3C69_18525 [Geminicoccaceae bacterium]
MALCLPALLCATPAAAGELVPQAFSARNLAAEPITCTATLAHWYSLQLGTAEAGERVLAELWHDPASGAVLLANEHGDLMPVERLWCGLEGRSWQTRSPIPLDRTPGGHPASIELDCRMANGRLACTDAHR